MVKIADLLRLVSILLLGVSVHPSLANGQVLPNREQAPRSAPGPSRPVAPPMQPELVTLNFSGADLVEVIHLFAQYLKLNYTIDPGVQGTVTLYSTQPLREEDLLKIFHQVLRINQAIAVKSGDFYHIAPIKDGKGLVRPWRQRNEHGYILQVVQVRFFSVAELKRLLEPFVSQGGEIIGYPRGNFLIIIDVADNIQRLLEIKELIDVNVFAGVHMELYKPRSASAEDLAEEMDGIMKAYSASVNQEENFAARFIPIPRINRLLVISHGKEAWTYVSRWLKRIDTYGEGPGRKIFVYPVENGKAVDLADILNQVLGQGPTGTGAPRKTLRDVAERIAGGQLQTPSGGSTPAGQTGSGTGQSGSLYAVSPAQAQPQQGRSQPSARPVPSQGPAEAKENKVRIVPDAVTNSLIVFGTAQEFQNIRNILKEIDIVPRQVLMDVMIAEVTLTDDLQFGIEYQILRGDVEIFGRDFDQHVSLLSGLPLPLPGGAGPSALSAVIGTGSDIRAFLNARREDSRVKVLSSPTILATDGQPARIQVGTEEPIPTGTVQSPVSGGTITSSTTIQYRNTGRILTIIPQVNAEGLVNLQVKVEVSQRGPSVTVGQDSFPSFDTRDAETTAVVQDGETLAIGGIITERVNRKRIGIPFLMDVPVLGRFFGTTTDDIDRTELIMLITPHVIRSKEEARSVTEEFKYTLQGVVEEYKWEIMNLERQKRKGEENIQEETIPEKKENSTSSGEGKSQESFQGTTLAGFSRRISRRSLTLEVAPSRRAGRHPHREEEQTRPAIKETPDQQRAALPSMEFLSGLVEEVESSKKRMGEEKLIENISTKGSDSSQERTQVGVKRAIEEGYHELETLETPNHKTISPALTGKSFAKRKVTKKTYMREEAPGPVAIQPKFKAEKEKWSVKNARKALWSVQLHAFSREESALALVKKLQKSGSDAYLNKAAVKGRYWYRVRVGRFTSSKEAKAILNVLKKEERFQSAYVTVRYVSDR